MPPRKPHMLAEKLRRIRQGPCLSQSQMLERLGLKDEIPVNYMSAYELGKRVPSLLFVLRYARAANVSVEVLIDDRLELPEKLRGKKKSRPTSTG